MSGGEIKAVEGAALCGGALRYFDYVMAAFVTILLLSNVLGAGKVAVIDLPLVGEWPFGAGILFFPLSYVIGDDIVSVLILSNSGVAERSCPGARSRLTDNSSRVDALGGRT